MGWIPPLITLLAQGPSMPYNGGGPPPPPLSAGGQVPPDFSKNISILREPTGEITAYYFNFCY